MLIDFQVENEVWEFNTIQKQKIKGGISGGILGGILRTI